MMTTHQELDEAIRQATTSPTTKVERDLRRMLCAQRHGILAYMDDGEASWGGGDNHRPIDYMRESPEAIQQAWRDACLRQLAASAQAGDERASPLTTETEEVLVDALERITSYTFNSTYCGAVKNTACRCSSNCQVFYELEAADVALSQVQAQPAQGERSDEHIERDAANVATPAAKQEMTTHITQEQIELIYPRYGGDMINCAHAIARQAVANYINSQQVRVPMTELNIQKLMREAGLASIGNRDFRVGRGKKMTAPEQDAYEADLFFARAIEAHHNIKGVK